MDGDVLNMLSGMGRFLAEEGTYKFLDPLVKELTSRDPVNQRGISTLLVAEYNNIPTVTDSGLEKAYESRLEQWVAFYRKQGEEESADAVQQVLNQWGPF